MDAGAWSAKTWYSSWRASDEAWASLRRPEETASNISSARGFSRSSFFILYVYTEETPQGIYDGLAGHGIDVEPNLASGNIVTPMYDEFYIVDGKAEALRMAEQVE